MLNYIREVYNCIFDFVMHPGNYLPEYLMHIITVLSALAAICLTVVFVLAVIALTITLIRFLYVHLFLNTAFACYVIYYQIRIPHIELVKNKFKAEHPRSWPIKYWWQCMKSLRTVHWHFDQEKVELQCMELTFDFSPLFWFNVTRSKELQAYIDNGWKIPDSGDQDD